MAYPYDLDPEGTRLPVRFDGTSNGEFLPLRLTPAQRRANDLAHELASENARRLGIGRRAFLTSAMGTAAVLTACNRVNPDSGGNYALERDATFENAAAAETLSGDEFIFDVQLHTVDPSGSWAKGLDGDRWRAMLAQAFPQAEKCAAGGFDCYSARSLVKEVFLDSDTDAGVISALFGTTTPTPIAYASEARGLIESLGGGKHRALIHGGVLPNLPGEIEAMEEKATIHRVAAWKLYPQWGPDGRGYWLDGPLAERMFAEARRLGIRTFAAHKGVALFGMDPALSSPHDMSRAAKANPDLTFLVYHSAFQPGVKEGPYNPSGKGVDRLIKAHRDAGLPRNGGNLYAELGSTWRYFMSRPDEAAHVFGKLLATFGEDRIIWGTDSIWYGSPQDQIQAFRAFQIGERYQEKYGYPPLTADAKRKIFGLNAAHVYGLDVAAIRTPGLQAARAEYRAAPNPSFRPYGPSTRREFLALQQEHGGLPA